MRPPTEEQCLSSVRLFLTAIAAWHRRAIDIDSAKRAVWAGKRIAQ
ncbi:MAG: hypothetical protein H6714_00300 [Myxococcales bacterium]|nr:hypothetical protein [Myxococcales bacterium]